MAEWQPFNTKGDNISCDYGKRRVILSSMRYLTDLRRKEKLTLHAEKIFL